MTTYSVIDTAARMLMALYFLISVAYALRTTERLHHVQVLGNSHVPFPALAFWIGLAVMTVGGVLLICGWQLQIAAWLLIVFTIASNLIYNRYWKVPDPVLRKFKQMLFYADWSVLGGLLLVLRDAG